MVDVKSPLKRHAPSPSSSPAPKLSRPSSLPRSFFDQPVLSLARSLLGTRLVVRRSSSLLSGVIMETEAYDGAADPAAHSRRGKTPRNASMFADPGTLYVYRIYGCYCCLNISSRGDGCAVLIRALAPGDGREEMRTKRTNSKTGKAPGKERDLCNGPSKLCQALGVGMEMDGVDACGDGQVWLEKGSVGNQEVVQCTRIGIEGSGEEAVKMKYRFYVRGSEFVSKRDKEAEKEEK